MYYFYLNLYVIKIGHFCQISLKDESICKAWTFKEFKNSTISWDVIVKLNRSLFSSCKIRSSYAGAMLMSADSFDTDDTKNQFVNTAEPS